MYEELITTLREYAEWADANIYEVPITLPDVLRKAANMIEELQIVVNFNKFNSKFWEDRYNSLWDIISPLIEANKEET